MIVFQEHNYWLLRHLLVRCSIGSCAFVEHADLTIACTLRRPALTIDEEVAEKVFHSAYIPKKLEEVSHYERDHDRLRNGGNTEGIYYQVSSSTRTETFCLPYVLMWFKLTD